MILRIRLRQKKCDLEMKEKRVEMAKSRPIKSWDFGWVS
jgi:hypothetical protein